MGSIRSLLNSGRMEDLSVEVFGGKVKRWCVKHPKSTSLKSTDLEGMLGGGGGGGGVGEHFINTH